MSTEPQTPAETPQPTPAPEPSTPSEPTSPTAHETAQPPTGEQIDANVRANSQTPARADEPMHEVERGDAPTPEEVEENARRNSTGPTAPNTRAVDQAPFNASVSGAPENK